MQELVNECISYVVSNLHDVVRLPIDMSCLNIDLIKQISLKVPMGKLDSLVDKRDKLTSKIFQKKLENMFFLLKQSNYYDSECHLHLWLETLNEDLQLF
jgi:hypothetical protein